MGREILFNLSSRVSCCFNQALINFVVTCKKLKKNVDEQTTTFSVDKLGRYCFQLVTMNDKTVKIDTCTVMQYFIQLDSKIKLFTETSQKKHLIRIKFSSHLWYLWTKSRKICQTVGKGFPVLSRLSDENPSSVVPISQGTARKYFTTSQVFMSI